MNTISSADLKPQSTFQMLSFYDRNGHNPAMLVSSVSLQNVRFISKEPQNLVPKTLKIQSINKLLSYLNIWILGLDFEFICFDRKPNPQGCFYIVSCLLSPFNECVWGCMRIVLPGPCVLSSFKGLTVTNCQGRCELPSMFMKVQVAVIQPRRASGSPAFWKCDCNFRRASDLLACAPWPPVRRSILCHTSLAVLSGLYRKRCNFLGWIQDRRALRAWELARSHCACCLSPLSGLGRAPLTTSQNPCWLAQFLNAIVKLMAFVPSKTVTTWWLCWTTATTSGCAAAAGASWLSLFACMISQRKRIGPNNL